MGDIIEGAPKLAPFNPSSNDVIKETCRLAGLDNTGSDRTREVVYDLGCGDGRLLIHIARSFGCKCVGIEYDRRMVDRAMANAKEHGVEDLVEIRRENIVEVTDLHRATIIFMYLCVNENAELKKLIQESYDSGARIISNMFSLKYLEPVEVAVCDGITRLYCYYKETDEEKSSRQASEKVEREENDLIKVLQAFFDPLKNPAIILIFNVAMVGMFLLVLPLLYAAGVAMIHLISISLLSVALLLSVNWFLGELRKAVERNEKEKEKSE